MSKLKIPHDAFVFVGDGRKALFLRNRGDEKFPNLRAEKVFEDENPPTHEQGSERPGRVQAAVTARRSAVEPTEWHDIEEHRFARQVAAAMEQSTRHHVDDVVLYLARHKIKAEGRVETHLLGSGADQIIGFAEDEDADLLVTGAYGHNRLNEWIFGGMTRDLLASSPFCCLMSH
jgi:protein required for attachment to host cells